MYMQVEAYSTLRDTSIDTILIEMTYMSPLYMHAVMYMYKNIMSLLPSLSHAYIAVSSRRYVYMYADMFNKNINSTTLRVRKHIYMSLLK